MIDDFTKEEKLSGGAVFEIGVKQSKEHKAIRRIAEPLMKKHWKDQDLSCKGCNYASASRRRRGVLAETERGKPRRLTRPRCRLITEVPLAKRVFGAGIPLYSTNESH